MEVVLSVAEGSFPTWSHGRYVVFPSSDDFKEVQIYGTQGSVAKRVLILEGLPPPHTHTHTYFRQIFPLTEEIKTPNS